MKNRKDSYTKTFANGETHLNLQVDHSIFKKQRSFPLGTWILYEMEVAQVSVLDKEQKVIGVQTGFASVYSRHGIKCFPLTAVNHNWADSYQRLYNRTYAELKARFRGCLQFSIYQFFVDHFERCMALKHEKRRAAFFSKLQADLLTLSKLKKKECLLFFET